MKTNMQCGVAVIFFMLGGAITGLADVPGLINYQGRLTDQTGKPVNTTTTMTFIIYDNQNRTTALWKETHPSITVTDGLFSVLLGSVMPVGKEVFAAGDTRYLGIRLKDGTETVPPMPIVTVAYAFKAAGADTAEVARKSLDSGSGGESLWGLTVNDLFYTKGFVGIGTASPQSRLHVAGGEWNVSATEGDFKIGDANYRLKIGVALGGGGAGDVRIRAVGGTHRMFLGSNTSDILRIAPDGLALGSGERDFRIQEAKTTDTGGWTNFLSYGGLKLGSVTGDTQQMFVFSDGVGAQNIFTVASSDNSGSTWKANFVIQQNGDVGIGDPAPDAKLKVQAAYGKAIYGKASGGLQFLGYGVYGEGGFAGGVGVHGSNPTNGTSGSLGGGSYGVKSNGDIVLEKGDIVIENSNSAVRGNIGPNKGAPFPRPAYDSGWVALAQEEQTALYHNIGGNVDNYIVDMQLGKDLGDGVYNIHNIGLGADKYEYQNTTTNEGLGAHYRYLDKERIIVQRQRRDLGVTHVRIRIWVYN
jgi:hypothetical protein